MMMTKSQATLIISHWYAMESGENEFYLLLNEPLWTTQISLSIHLITN